MRDVDFWGQLAAHTIPNLTRALELERKLNWCRETFGAEGTRWGVSMGCIWFAQPKDETLFNIQFSE